MPKPEPVPIAIVTGASRRGAIGAAICRALAEAGFDVAFTHWRGYDRELGSGLDEGGPDALAADVAVFGRRALPVELDLSAPDCAGRLFDLVERGLGSATVLVNNAAHSTRDDVLTLDAAALDAHHAVNVRATALLSVEFARRWRAREGGAGGRIVNLTSGQSQGPMPGELAYAASKGAVEAFTVSLAAGVAPFGITANAVNPGPTDSGWMSPEIQAELLPRFPFGRIGRPDDVARLVAFLAGPDAAWITGQILHSEGGFTRG